MDIWDEIKTLAGYQSGRGGVDSYGVDHSGFSTRDELEYQSARLARENQLAEGFAKQGIAEENYPQYGTNFWGGSPENNYGFGTSNIKQNIENVTNRLNNDANSGQVTTNSDYTVNTESLVGKPSSYFQNNNTSAGNNSVGSWGNNGTSGLGSTPNNWSSNNGGYNNLAQSGNSSEKQNTGGYDYAEAQKQAQILQAQRNAVNQILMYGMDVLYGANRTLNGASLGLLDYLGNKLGYDTQMNAYLQLKTPQEREAAQTVGKLVGYGGNALTDSALVKTGLNQANIAYNGYKIGKKYDQLVDDPFQGNGTDVITHMKDHNGEPVVLQRGEAILDENGNVIVHGKALGRITGTIRNNGLNKAIYRHWVEKQDAKRIPRIIQKQPVETSPRGQYTYTAPSKNGIFQVVTSPTKNGRIISSTYYYLQK